MEAPSLLPRPIRRQDHSEDLATPAGFEGTPNDEKQNENLQSPLETRRSRSLKKTRHYAERSQGSKTGRSRGERGAERRSESGDRGAGGDAAAGVTKLGSPKPTS